MTIDLIVGVGDEEYFEVDRDDMVDIIRLIRAITTDGFVLTDEAIEEAREIVKSFNVEWEIE